MEPPHVGCYFAGRLRRVGVSPVGFVPDPILRGFVDILLVSENDGGEIMDLHVAIHEKNGRNVFVSIAGYFWTGKICSGGTVPADEEDGRRSRNNPGK